MTYPSRHLRPQTPPNLHLQPRDHELLHSVFHHRYLLGRHVAALHFRGSLRPAQSRLRQLWAHRYLDRTLLPLQHDGGVRLSPPLYSLALRGAEVVSADTKLALPDIPHTPKANAKGFATMAHNLVTTDLLVAAQCLNTEQLAFATQQEFQLRRQLALARARGRWRGPALVPDGALRLFSRGNGPPLFPDGNDRPQTYYVETVRSGIRGGNQTLARKCLLYAKLHHAGFFRQVFGHEHVRAVLILTTSQARADHLRQLVRQQRHGRNLFWFGVTASRPPASLAPSATVEHITAPIWLTVDGQPVAIYQRPADSSPAINQPHV